MGPKAPGAEGTYGTQMMTSSSATAAARPRAARVRLRAILMPLAAGLGIGIWAWFCASSLQPLAYDDRPLEYLFLGASLPVFAVAGLAAALALLAAHLWMLRTQTFQPGARPEAYLAPLAMLALAALGGVVLLPNVGSRLSVFAYVAVDLRVWWSLALIALALWRLDRLRGGAVWSRARQAARRFTPAGRRFAYDAALFLLVLVFSLVSARYLRFTSVLHGDEPKYMRYCENFYQGLGLDVGRQQPLYELTLGFDPPLWRNVALFGQAVRQDLGFLASDLRQLARERTAMRFNRAQYIDGWFLRGRDGGFYQVHNPGLSFVLFPAYFIDRHFLATSAGYQDVFPTLLPATNLTILLIWSVWAVTLFRLLRAATGRDGLAWLLAAAAMLTMPVSAFGFQIYPEAAGGMIVTLLFIWLVFRRPDDSARGIALAAGAAVGFLPWLHVRFILLSAVLAVWALFTLRRRRLAFACGYGAVIAALGAYAYHLTGSFMPDAMYQAEGGAAPWRAPAAMEALAAYPLDRIWGFLPHAPVYLFAVPGWLLAARRWPRAAALSALLILALIVPSAGHGFSAAGATPLRHLVAVVPLAMIPMAATLLAFGRVPWVRATFIVLLTLSLHAALFYNLHHRKEVGRFVDHAVSGWSSNLLFPWTHAGPWQHWRGTFVLFLLWVAALALLFVVPYLRRHAAGPPAPLRLPHMVAAILVFVVLGSGATALGGEWVRADYLVPLARARAASIDFASALDRCRACYSTARGEVGRGDVLADEGHTFEFHALNPEVRAGEPVIFRAVAQARHGAAWGPLALDFGDDAVTRMEVRGDAFVDHVYRVPGRYHATARFTPYGAPPLQTHASIAVRAARLEVADALELPEAIRRAPVRGTIARVWLGPDGVSAQTSGTQGPAVVWLLRWNGEGWSVVPEPARTELAAGTWVAVIAAAADASYRTPPVEVRWPDRAVAIATRVALYEPAVSESPAPR